MTITRRKILLMLAGSMAFARASRAAEPIGRFMLEDVNGAIVDDSMLRGRFALVFFGYTNCPDFCPTALLTVSSVLSLLGNKAERILPLFVSLDPARDTRQLLSAYAANFDGRIVPLRGTEPYVEAAAKAFAVTYRKVVKDPARPDDYAIDHSASIILVDPDGQIVRRFGYNQAADSIVAELGPIIAASPAGGN